MRRELGQTIQLGGKNLTQRNCTQRNFKKKQNLTKRKYVL